MSMNEQKTKSRAGQILAAIENTKYKSRTVGGISREIGISNDEIKATLNSDGLLKSRVMVVPGVRKGNQPLYVTVERYKKETPLAVRVLNLIKKKEYTNE